MTKFIEVTEGFGLIKINVSHIIKYNDITIRNDKSSRIVLINNIQLFVLESCEEITTKIEGERKPQLNKYLTIDNCKLRVINKRLFEENQELKRKLNEN